MMGKVAERLSDFPVVTSDNPRTEDPDRIIADVLEGMSDGTVAIDRSKRGDRARDFHPQSVTDTILVAGKGHEYYQIIGTERLRFSDVDVSAKYLTVRVTGAGVEEK